MKPASPASASISSNTLDSTPTTPRSAIPSRKRAKRAISNSYWRCTIPRTSKVFGRRTRSRPSPRTARRAAPHETLYASTSKSGMASDQWLRLYRSSPPRQQGNLWETLIPVSPAHASGFSSQCYLTSTCRSLRLRLQIATPLAAPTHVL